MNGNSTLRLRDFVASREDPRILLLDVRLPVERAAVSLENRFFTVIHTPRPDVPKTLVALATLLGARHVVVVDELEAGARDAAHLLRSIEVDAAALENGLAGWVSAVVEESCEVHDALQVVSLVRVVSMLHSYILLEAGEAIVVNPSGCVDAFLAEFQRHRCRPIAVIDTEIRRQDVSCGPAICAITGVPYYVPERAPKRVGFAELSTRPSGELLVTAADVCITRT
ncbi:MAG TPA: hypothetical protein VMA36_05125 [Candidatus Limnocylindria bacterium]|nr:hypothetical protein [Candidatus Limnocylindria bacterium]